MKRKLQIPTNGFNAPEFPCPANFVPFWLDEKIWLITVVHIPTPDDSAERRLSAEYIGYLSAYGIITDARVLAVVGDPDPECYMMELLFSFATEEGRTEFLRLCRSNEFTDYDDETFSTDPAAEEIADARPVGLVLPKDVTKMSEIVGVAILANDLNPPETVN